MLLSHADILVHDGNWSVLHDGFIGVEGDTIRYIGAKRPAQDFGPEKNLSNCLVMAGCTIRIRIRP